MILSPIFLPVTLELYRKRTGATAWVSLDLRSSLSIQPFEGSRFVRGGRYGISIDFGLEVVEKKSICGASFKSKFIDLNMESQAHDRLIVTRDRPFCNTRDADARDLFVCTSRISDAACFEHAIASAAKRLRSNAFIVTYVVKFPRSRLLARIIS